MNRYFLRPFFDLHDAFFPFRRMLRPTYRVFYTQTPAQKIQYEQPPKNDPHALFEQFFKENEIKSEAEKEFFQKHYPETVEEKFDPYKVLEVNNDASLEEVKDAYRNLAIKYHPKNDSSPEAAVKFSEIAKAYDAIMEAEKTKSEDIGFKSFFQDFEKQVESIFYPKRSKQAKSVKPEQYNKEIKEGEKTEAKNDLGVLYSESSQYESVNGQQTKFVAEKYYKKDGKVLKVTREEKLKEDGNVEITETIDNGSEVKKKTFTQEKGTKSIGN